MRGHLGVIMTLLDCCRFGKALGQNLVISAIVGVPLNLELIAMNSGPVVRHRHQIMNRSSNSGFSLQVPWIPAAHSRRRRP